MRTYARHDLGLHVGHDLVPALALGRSLARDELAEVSRLNSGGHTTLTHRLHVLGDVVDHLSAALTELFAIHVGIST